MKHFPFLLSLAAGLGTACILGGFSAAADSAGVTVPVATETTQPSGNWGVTESGSRCYYNAQGECVTGEVTIDGTDYLFDYTGAQKTGWRTVNGIRRYYDPVTGEPVSGWVESGGHRYYADSDTGKLTGEQTLDGHRYQFDPDCGTQTVGVCTFADGTVSYYNSINGSIQTGWQKDGRDIYYFSPDTETALVGMQQLDGSSYYFESDGKLVRSQTVLIDGVTYRAADDGKLSTNTTPVMGKSQATAAQMAAYIRSVNPNVAQSVLDMIPYYLSEGEAEGVRGDIAFAQSCLETGNFTFRGSAVTLSQNNFCGMGVTQNGMKGNSFATPQLGIRAQIQHLKAYASTEPLKQDCIDTRFRYVQRGCAPYVEWLGIQENPNRKGWAAGANYGAKILRILAQILQM